MTREDRFFSWLQENGFKVQGCEISSKENGYRGVFATEALNSNYQLFEIPNKSLLSTVNSSIADILAKCDPYTVSEWDKLCLAVMFEHNNPDSHWRAYFDALPEKFDNPVFWSDDELAELKGTSLEKRTGIKEINEQFDNIILPLIEVIGEPFDPETHDFELFRRCGAIIQAYSFSDGPQMAIVPFADFLNHKTGYNNARLFDDNDDDDESDEEPSIDDDEIEEEEEQEQQQEPEEENVEQEHHHHHGDNCCGDSDCEDSDCCGSDSDDGNCGAFAFNEARPLELAMKTIKRIKAGEELFNTYGDLGNSELLRKYGFVDDKNPFTIAEAQISEVVDSLIKHFKEENQSILSSSGIRKQLSLRKELIDDVFELFCDDDCCENISETMLEANIPLKGSDIPPLLMMLARIMIIPSDSMSSITLEDLLTPASQNPEVQKKLKYALLTVVEDRLKRFPTSIDSDRSLLKSHSSGEIRLTHRLRSAIVLRLHEKELLEKYHSRINRSRNLQI